MCLRRYLFYVIIGKMKKQILALKLLLFLTASIMYCPGFAFGGSRFGFSEIEKLIRDRIISAEEARKCMPFFMGELDNAYFAATKGKWYGSGIREFPVMGYGSRDIGGKSGSGYYARHFDFYNQNTKKTHPAYDIFIKDNDHNLLDDDTLKPVAIVASSAGIVASVNTGWLIGLTRGGNYVWVYNGDDKRLYYYAHLQQVCVHEGDFVNAGQVLGFAGRTGYEAAKKRSPTHLHLMTLQYMGLGSFRPIDTGRELQKTGRAMKRLSP